ncbi:MAG: DUF4097 family beta strand repeat-containing protein [Ilumatobacter sp.]|uniref:DUF4097 family beta strand repeat-containing protein n=1 Tax=Ilumatobacter sp. TaxID=1967498 RepID=UPI00260CA55E|nr:DUF4097 family beta strand repeat-containing protein [Ilumatobacter sp.]MDJ0768012.1 DUF4097 family beta strand repeat-containing protein [Ilumatobacter sp.]
MASLPVLPALIGAALLVSGCSLSVDLGDGDTKRRVETDTIPIADLTRLDVSTGNGAIEVTAADVEEIVVRSVFRESDPGDASSEIDVGTDELVVRGVCDSGWFESCQVAFELTVPADLDVSVDTDNGRILVDGVAGDVALTSNNGAVTGLHLASDDARAETDNGRVELRFDDVPDFVDAVSDNGAIEIMVPDEAYDVEAITDNGGIDVDVVDQDDAERRIIAETDNGSIHVGAA